MTSHEFAQKLLELPDLYLKFSVMEEIGDTGNFQELDDFAVSNYKDKCLIVYSNNNYQKYWLNQNYPNTSIVIMSI